MDARTFLGVPVVRNRSMPALQEWKQIRFPRSKRARIRKKWRKRQENWGFVAKPPVFYMTPFGILGHPDVIDMLIADIEQRAKGGN